jgi:predicted porin
LGGDCCADLEERIAELEATTARKGNRKMSLQVYGQVNTVVMAWDNGTDRAAYIVDGATETSRFGFKGTAKIRQGLTAGFRLEVSAISAPSNGVTEIDDDAGSAGDGVLAVRHANWFIRDDKIGTLTLGRTDMTTGGITEIDLGGSNIVAKAGVYFGNDIEIMSTAGVGVGNFDAFAVGNFEYDRNNAVRYDTPAIAGFRGSAAWGEDERWDVALRYAGEFSGFRVAAGIAYGVDTDELAVGQERTFLGGSASVLHTASGLFLTGAWAERTRDPGDDSETYWSVRGGISKNWFGIGKTVLYAEYHNFENVLEDVAEIRGLGIVQNIDAAAMEVYLAYKQNVVDLVSGVDTHDLDIVIAGARIRF